MACRFTGFFFAFCVLILAPAETTADSPSDTLPDSWSGQISLEWKSGIPDESPLHQQVEHVAMNYQKEWRMQVDFREINRDPTRVRYRCESASVTYLQTSKIDGKNGAVRTHEDWKIKAEDRILNHRQCNVVMVVDVVEKRYWIDEVGRFEIPDAGKTGTIVMSIEGGSSPRSVTEPIDKEVDIVEPIRFEGRFDDPNPRLLSGSMDANVTPPPGLDITHETLGGTITWQLYPGWRFLEDPFVFSNACPDFSPEFDECRTDDLCFCLYVTTVMNGDRLPGEVGLITDEECLELYCPWEPGTPKFQQALEIVQDLIGEIRPL